MFRQMRAPGRVNLIGDHTDYHGGFCLPMAIDLQTVVTWRPRNDRLVVARSEELDGEVEVPADGSAAPEAVEPRWGGFVAGVVRALADLGRRPVGADLMISSTVPTGSGLSSSSALAVALTLALAEAGELELVDPASTARAALRAEVLATGVPGGLMDQLCALLGRAGHALLIDCQSLAVEPIPLPESLAVLVVHCGKPRVLAGSAYAERRAASEAVVRALGIHTLRDASFDQVINEPLARHVVTENARVLEFADALRGDDHTKLGALLVASHASLRDDYRVSTPELDLLVELLVEHGAPGARLTGAGFGGCVVALVPRHHVDDCAAQTTAAYHAKSGLVPSAFVMHAADGAGEIFS